MRLFVARHSGHLWVIEYNELADLRELVVVLLKLFPHVHEWIEMAQLASERRHALGVSYRPGIGKLSLDFTGPLNGLGKAIAETQLFVEAGAAGVALEAWPLEYFWRKRSTLPAVSTSFCLPVKNGWHCAQISV